MPLRKRQEIQAVCGRDNARRFVEFIWKDAEIKDDFRQWVDL